MITKLSFGSLNQQTPFPNLGDGANKAHPSIVAKEAEEAGLKWLPAGVKTHRSWYYWGINLPEPEITSNELKDILNSDKSQAAKDRAYQDLFKKRFKPEMALPAEIARPLNQEHGTVIRAFGYAGGMSGKEFEKWMASHKGVSSWHVDTKEGLKKLADTLLEYFAKLRK